MEKKQQVDQENCAADAFFGGAFLAALDEKCSGKYTQNTGGQKNGIFNAELKIEIDIAKKQYQWFESVGRNMLQNRQQEQKKQKINR